MRRERSRRQRPQRARKSGALAEAIARREWERVALYVLLGVALSSRDAPETALDDVLDVLAGREVRSERVAD